MVTQWIALLFLPLSAFASPVDLPVLLSHGGVRYLSGSNGYGYIGEDQYKIEMRNSDGSVEGVYGYKMPDGTMHTTSYVSDERGYRLQENDVLERYLAGERELHQVKQGSSIQPKSFSEYEILSNDQVGPATAICQQIAGKDYEADCSAKILNIYEYYSGCYPDAMCGSFPCIRISDKESPNYKWITPPEGTSCATRKVCKAEKCFSDSKTYWQALSDDQMGPANATCLQLAGKNFEAYCSPENVNRYRNSSRHNFCRPEDMCERFTCFKRKNGKHIFQRVTPREGASCGARKVCKANKCISDSKTSWERRPDHAVALPDATAISLRKGVSQSRIQATAIADKEAYASPVASSYSGKEGMSLSAPSGVAIVGPGGIAIADTYSLSYSSMSDADIEKLREETAKKRKQMKTNPNPQPLYYKDFIGYKQRF